MNNTTQVGRQLAPLCYMPDGRLVCYRHGDILIFRDEALLKRFSLFSTLKEKLVGRFRLLYRLLRLGIRAALAIDNQYILLSVAHRLYELDIETGILSDGCSCDKDVRPLLFTHVQGIEGFDDGIYYGGYFLNREKQPIHIYQRLGVDCWERVYTFSQGTINHVHQIVSDPYRQCVWVFTGDFDEASAIWKVSNHFRTVERVVCNDQRYRACVVHALPEGLLYATDSPYNNDYIYLFRPESMELDKLYPISGSCIYGCRWRDQYVFSSTVEGDGRHLTPWQFCFSRKRGSAIKDDNVHLYVGHPKTGFNEIYQEKKDGWPFYTFQFGVFKFPYGDNMGNTLYFQPVATKINDLSLMAYHE